MTKIKQTDPGRVAIFGASGSGKSTRMRAHCAELRRLLVFDTQDEHSGPMGLTRCKSLEAVRAAMVDSPSAFRIAYVPTGGQEAKRLSQLCELLKIAQTPYSGGRSAAHVFLVVEELNTSFPVSGGEARCPGFADVCSRGRGHGIGIIGLTQSPAEVSMRFRSNVSAAAVFRLPIPAHQDAAAKMMQQADAAAIGRQEPHEYLWWEVGMKEPIPRRNKLR